MLVVFCFLFDFIVVCTICVFYSVCIMCYCGSVSDDLGPLVLMNLI